MKNELSEQFDDDNTKMASVQETLEEIFIPRMELQASKKPHIVRYTMYNKLKPLIDFRDSMFERVYPLSEKLARKMLDVGYKQPSCFGMWDPVKMLEDGDVIQPLQGPNNPTFPVMYRQHIYFFSSIPTREKFIRHPLMYIRQPPAMPVVPIRMAIIGPPKSGKTALANRFVQEFGVMRISIGEAIRNVLTNQKKSDLAKLINAQLYKGLTVPDELAVQALEVSLMDMVPQTRGYVLDGFPVTKRQVDLMTQRAIIPVVVLELQVSGKEVIVRAGKDRSSPNRTLPLHDSPQIMAIKLAAWQEQVGGVRKWYQSEHRNWLGVDGERSKWWVWNKAKNESHKSVQQIQTYLKSIGQGKAASIADMCVTPSECKARLGDFGEYCPVSLAITGELVDCSTNPLWSSPLSSGDTTTSKMMAGKTELEKFLANPEQFTPPLAPRKLPPPELLPQRRTSDEVRLMFPKQIELQGYCPVTFLDGKLRYEAIVPGNNELVVEYKDKLYVFETEEKLQKFMRLPEKYSDLKLPHKLPPKKEPIPINSLPMLGYMEQTVATAITKSLTAVGCFKPKYPFMGTTESALLYIAFHLKAHNPKASEYVRKKYRKKLQHFEEQCNLIKFLGEHMTRRYREPQERPIGFDEKMEVFLALRGHGPATTWVA
ncbi:adenylate kinase [Branchiostoma belcheri]|nr:adenylate kinase [Branchiostoma belcheri]